MHLLASCKVLLAFAGLVHMAGVGWLFADLGWLWLGQLGPPGPGPHVSHAPAGEPKHFSLGSGRREKQTSPTVYALSKLLFRSYLLASIAKTSHAAGPRVRILRRYKAQGTDTGQDKELGATDTISPPHLSPVFFLLEKCQNKIKFQSKKKKSFS